MQVIVPKIVDDISKTFCSYNIVKIDENTRTLSKKYYRINEAYYRFKCENVVKIKCKSKTSVYVYLSSFYLEKEEAGGVKIGDFLSSYQIVAEDLGNSYNICIGVLGGSGNTYFTDKSKNTNSYVYLEVIQVCR